MIKVVYLASPEIAVKALCELNKSEQIKIEGVVTNVDKPANRGQKNTSTPVRSNAEELGITVFQTRKFRDDIELIEKLKNIAPDFFVTFAFGHILSDEILEIPKYGTINLHASLLPFYRGANPIQRAVVNGEKVTGITTMLTVKELDAGDICLQEEIPITENMNSVELMEVISEKAGMLLIKTLCGIKDGTISPKAQDHDKKTFAYKFKKEDGLISFLEPAEEIHNKTRGMQPWPNVYFNYKGKSIKILKTEYNKDSEIYLNIGEVLDISKKGILVSTKKGAVLLERVKPEGKKEMTAFDWSNGLQLKKGAILCQQEGLEGQ